MYSKNTSNAFLGDRTVTEQELQLLTRNTMALEAIRDTLRKIYADVQMLRQNDKPPNYQYDIKAFSNFNWDLIGATVVERDRYGAAAVTYCGHTYIRRSPQNKFTDAIWFSRCTGKGENGENVYMRLITFKKRNCPVEPLPERVLHQVATASLPSN